MTDYKLTTLYLERQHLDQIEEKCKKEGYNRSQYIRKLIHAGLVGDAEGIIIENLKWEKDYIQLKLDFDHLSKQVNKITKNAKNENGLSRLDDLMDAEKNWAITAKKAKQFEVDVKSRYNWFTNEYGNLVEFEDYYRKLKEA